MAETATETMDQTQEAAGAGNDGPSAGSTTAPTVSLDLPDGWDTHLSEEIRPVLQAANLPREGGIVKLAEMFANTKKKIGADKIVLPGRNASDEEVLEFHKKIGYPGDKDGYEKPEKLPEGFELDEESEGRWREIADRMKLSKQQAGQLLHEWAELQTQGAKQLEESMIQARADAEKEMRVKWGMAFEQNVDLAKQAVTWAGGDDLKKRLDETGLGNDPVLIDAFAKLGKLIASDPIVGGGSGANFVMSPQEAQREIQKLTGDEKFMDDLGKSHKVGHEEARRRWDELHALAYGKR